MLKGTKFCQDFANADLALLSKKLFSAFSHCLSSTEEDTMEKADADPESVLQILTLLFT